MSSKQDVRAGSSGEAPPKVISDLLSLVMDTRIPAEVIATWTVSERTQAVHWAAGEHLHASDNDDVIRVPEPEFVRVAAEICANPVMAQLAVEYWITHKDILTASAALYDNNLTATVAAAQAAITGLLVLKNRAAS